MEKYKDFINIQGYKYNGELYKQWNGAKVLFENNSYLCVFLLKTKVSELKEFKYIINDPIIWFFHKKYFFNYNVTIKEDGNYFYANLSSPYIFEDNTIKYIDFDLDIKKYPNKIFHIVDNKEFQTNSEKWYDKKLIKVILDNLSILTEIIVKENHFFDPNKIKLIINELKKEKQISCK
ncbi:MAG: DUF402 domain-containing protein [Metamycoplasmataceae bacterium]